MAVGADTLTKEISQWQRFVWPWELYGSPWLWKSRNGCGNAYAAVGNSTTAISHSNFAPDAGDSSRSSPMWQPQPQSRWRHRVRAALDESPLEWQLGANPCKHGAMQENKRRPVAQL